MSIFGLKCLLLHVLSMLKRVDLGKIPVSWLGFKLSGWPIKWTEVHTRNKIEDYKNYTNWKEGHPANNYFAAIRQSDGLWSAGIGKALLTYICIKPPAPLVDETSTTTTTTRAPLSRPYRRRKTLQPSKQPEVESTVLGQLDALIDKLSVKFLLESKSLTSYSLGQNVRRS